VITFSKSRFNESGRSNAKPFKYIDRPKLRRSVNMKQRDWIKYYGSCWYMQEYMRQYFELIKPRKTYIF